ncbi:MAG: hypothetical protein AAB652_01960 [Patescibacteria group bacterium]
MEFTKNSVDVQKITLAEISNENDLVLRIKMGGGDILHLAPIKVSAGEFALAENDDPAFFCVVNLPVNGSDSLFEVNGCLNYLARNGIKVSQFPIKKISIARDGNEAEHLRFVAEESPWDADS